MENESGDLARLHCSPTDENCAGLRHIDNALQEPRHASETKKREIEKPLVSHKEEWQPIQVLSLQQFFRPQKHWERMNVGISSGTGFSHVGDSMVMVVLGLPPRHREPLEKVTDQKPKCVVPPTLLEELVMTDIVT
mmetsp:Transcript_36567/g.146163  ORF Transcript_36567/g.146163 Transcript_36567/m.146163 type:complete len:136 (-) Transcript_36567:713-1120(-)